MVALAEIVRSFEFSRRRRVILIVARAGSQPESLAGRRFPRANVESGAKHFFCKDLSSPLLADRLWTFALKAATEAEDRARVACRDGYVSWYNIRKAGVTVLLPG